MKSFFIISFFFVNSVFSQNNNVHWHDIIQKIKYFKKNKKEPFNGKVFGSKSGIMKYGVKTGIWENLKLTLPNPLDYMLMEKMKSGYFYQTTNSIKIYYFNNLEMVLLNFWIMV